MKLEECQFTLEEIKKIEQYRDTQADARLKQRFISLRMLAEKGSPEQIKRVLGVPQSTLKRWTESYYTQGLDALNSFQYKPKECSLSKEQQKELKQWVKENLPGNRETIVAYILKTYGVPYDESSVGKLLKQLGIKKLKPKLQAGKPPPIERQVRFFLDYHQFRQFAQLDPDFVQLFVDGAHLHHQLIPTLCWGDPQDPPVLQTNTGRQRLNILGAYNAETCDFIHLTEEANWDSSQVIRFLEKLLHRYHHCHSILLHLDNAPYFHSQKVRQWLESHPQIILCPLPPYAPNLNLIERLWRFIKGHLVRNRYYEKYKTFRAQAFRLLNHVSDFESEIKQLINHKFELVIGKSHA